MTSSQLVRFVSDKRNLDVKRKYGAKLFWKFGRFVAIFSSKLQICQRNTVFFLRVLAGSDCSHIAGGQDGKTN